MGLAGEDFSSHTAHPLVKQTCTRDTGSPSPRPQVFSNDQWSLGGKNREGRHSCAPDEFGRIEEGSGRAGQAVQTAAGRYGEVEGKFLNSSFITATFTMSIP